MLVAAGCGSVQPECSLVGNWLLYPVMGNFEGMRVTQTFHEDGSYEISLNEAIFHAHWAFNEGVLTLSDDDSCQGAGPGMYHLTFDTCMSAVLSVISDSCEGRKTNFTGAHMVMP